MSSPALTKTPDVHIQGTLESGHPKNITCGVPWACDRGTPPTFSWIGVSLTSLDPKTLHSSVLTLTPGPQDHGTNLTCRVTFPGANVGAKRTILLNVSCERQAGPGAPGGHEGGRQGRRSPGGRGCGEGAGRARGLLTWGLSMKAWLG